MENIRDNKVEKKSPLGGVLILTVSTVIVKFLGMIYKIPLSYILSDEGMSYFNTAYAVYTLFFVLCSAGVPKAISVLIAESTGEGEKNKAHVIYKFSFILFTALGLISTLLLMLFASPIANLMGNRKSALSMIFIAPAILFVCSSSVLRGYFSGKLNHLPIAVSELIAGVGKLVFGLIFAALAYRSGASPEEISGFSILGITLGSFFGFIYLFAVKKREILPTIDNKSGEGEASFTLLKKLLKVAIPITLTAAVASLFNVLDTAALMRKLSEFGYSELQVSILYGNYSAVIIPMFNLVAALIAPLSTILLPLLSGLNSAGKYAEFIEKSSQFVLISSILSAPVAVLFATQADKILGIVFDDSSAAMAAPLLVTIAPAIVLMSLLTIINTIIEGAGNFTLPMVSLSIGALVKLLFTYFFTTNEAFGVYTAPIGTVISYGISLIISLVYLSIRFRSKVKIMRYAVLSNALAISVGAFVMYIENTLFYSRNSILWSVLILSLYLAIYMFLLAITHLLRRCFNKDRQILQKSAT